MADEVPGYTYGDESVLEGPFDLEDLEKLEDTVRWTDADDKHLHMASDLLADQTDEILHVWYGFVAENDHLLSYFGTADKPDERYLERVRARVEQWIVDTCEKPRDRDWLDYQYEIELRHHRAKKNETDDVESVANIDLRYLIAFIYPITATIRRFLQTGNHTDEEVDRMYHAWVKAVTLQVALWADPYAKEGDW